MNDRDLERRIERIEDELGIDADMAMFEEQMRSFATHSRVEIEDINGGVATLTISGKFNSELIKKIERRFNDWQYYQEEGVFQVSGLNDN